MIWTLVHPYFRSASYAVSLNSLTASEEVIEATKFTVFTVFGRTDISAILSRTILGDPGADSGDEGKSKRAEKYIWNEEK